MIIRIPIKIYINVIMPEMNSMPVQYEYVAISLANYCKLRVSVCNACKLGSKM